MKAGECGQFIRLPKENGMNAQIFNSNLFYPPKERNTLQSSSNRNISFY